MLIDWIIALLALTLLILIGIGAWRISVWASYVPPEVSEQQERLFIKLSERMEKQVTDPSRKFVIVFAGNFAQYAQWLNWQDTYERHQCRFISNAENLYGIYPDNIREIVCVGTYGLHQAWHSDYAQMLVRSFYKLDKPHPS